MSQVIQGDRRFDLGGARMRIEADDISGVGRIDVARDPVALELPCLGLSGHLQRGRDDARVAVQLACERRRTVLPRQPERPPRGRLTVGEHERVDRRHEGWRAGWRIDARLPAQGGIPRLTPVELEGEGGGRAFEPHAGKPVQSDPLDDGPDLRLRTGARLREAGLSTGILCSPLLPGITDTGKALDGIAKRAKEAGAVFFCAQPLFLKPCSKEIYLGFIREHFPSLEPMYRQRFDSDAFVSQTYRKRIEELVKAVCAKYGLGRRKDALLTRREGEFGERAGWDGTDTLPLLN